MVGFFCLICLGFWLCVCMHVCACLGQTKKKVVMSKMTVYEAYKIYFESNSNSQTPQKSMDLPRATKNKKSRQYLPSVNLLKVC